MDDSALLELVDLDGHTQSTLDTIATQFHSLSHLDTAELDWLGDLATQIRKTLDVDHWSYEVDSDHCMNSARDRAEAVDPALEVPQASSSGKRFSRQQVRVLVDWMKSHLQDPYPTAEQKEVLANATSLSQQQVSNFLTNYRRRKLLRLHSNGEIQRPGIGEGSEDRRVTEPKSESSSPKNDRQVADISSCSSDTASRMTSLSLRVRPRSPELQNVTGDGSALFELDDSTADNVSKRNSPVWSRFSSHPGDLLSWFLAHVPNDSGTPLSANGVVLSDGDGPQSAGRSRTGCHLVSSDQPQPKRNILPARHPVAFPIGNMDSSPVSSPGKYSYLEEDGVFGEGGVQTDAEPDDWTYRDPAPSETGSEAESSISSVSSCSTYASLGPRKGRKAYGGVQKRQDTTKTRPPHQHTCEYCGLSFTRPSSKKRHIATVHAISRYWICGPIVKDLCTGVCPICLEDSHLCAHKTRLLECWSKPEEQRTFYRRDTMNQHLRNVHSLGDQIEGDISDLARPVMSKDADTTMLFKSAELALVREHVISVLYDECDTDVTPRTPYACLVYLRNFIEAPGVAEGIGDFDTCWLEALRIALTLPPMCLNPVEKGFTAWEHELICTLRAIINNKLTMNKS